MQQLRLLTPYTLGLLIAVGLLLLAAPNNQSTSNVQAQAKGEADRNEVKDHTIETRRYRLDWYGTLEEAEQMGKLLESGFEELKKIFNAEPSVAGSTRLRIKVLADSAALIAEFRREQNVTLASGTSFHLELTNRTLYTCRGDTAHSRLDAFEMRFRLLLGAAFQFHHVAKSRTEFIDPIWYRGGIARFAANHSWDGTKATLGLVPLFKTEYNPVEICLPYISSPDFNLEARVKANAHADDRVFEGLFAWLYSESPETRRKLHRFIARIDNGHPIDVVFRSEIGGYKKVQEDFVNWIRGAQPKMATVPNSQAVMRGYGAIQLESNGTLGRPGIVATIDDVDWLQASLLTPTRNKVPAAGLVVSWEDKAANRRIVHFNAEGELVAVNVTGASSSNIVEETFKPAPTRDRSRRVLRAEYSEGKVKVLVDGREAFHFEAPRARMGLFSIESGTVDFEDISFTGFREPPPSNRPARGR
jgi:hypothetical protein